MPLVMYLTKAPKYKNIATDQYETVPKKDIELIEKYFTWQMVRSEGGNAGNSLMEWCGIPSSKLPHKYIVNYYNEFFTLKDVYEEYVGRTKVYSIFDQLARLGRVPHLIRWFLDNVEQNYAEQGYLEVSKDHLVMLLKICTLLKNRFAFKAHLENSAHQYTIDIDAAQKFLPLMEEMSDKCYGIAYVNSVIKFEEILRNILESVDFNKETVYFEYGNYG